MRYRLLAFLCLITVVAYVQRSAMNGATRSIEADLGISSAQLGLVMSGWYLLYSLFQLPAGWLADRLGSKTALVLFAVVWSLLTGLAGLAAGFWALLLVWGLMGAAQAGIFPCCTKAVGATFPKTEQAFASGALGCCMALGGALAPAVTGRLLDHLSWQAIFALYAVPGLVWAGWFAAGVPHPEPASGVGSTDDSTDDDPGRGRDRQTDSPPGRPVVRWSRLVTDPQMLLLNTQQFLRAGGMVFFYTWFARYLEEAKGVPAVEAGGLAFWPPFAGALGGLCGGLLSDGLYRRTGNPRLARQGMTFLALLVCTVLAGGAYFVADPVLAVFLISLGAFCGMASGVSAYALAMSYGGSRVATVFATMNMSGNLGATAFPVAVTLLVSRTGSWDVALLLFVGLFGAAAACWAVLNPRGTLFDEPTRSIEDGSNRGEKRRGNGGG